MDFIQCIELSRQAYRHNLATFRQLIGPRCRLMAVVKANAYGHGLAPIASLAAETGVDALGVNSIDEGAVIRQLGIRLPVVVLGYTPTSRLEQTLQLGLEPVLYNPESLHGLQAAARNGGAQAPFHLKLETGVHRQGVMEHDLPGLLDLVASLGNLRLKGVSMHFANIEDTTDHSFARIQLENFSRMISVVAARLGFRPEIHAACTAAAILFPETHFDMVRVGIGSYGLWPSKETYLATVLLKKEPPVLHPVLTWKTGVAQLKEVPADCYVGYGCSFRTTHRIRLAVLPVGYYDGYDRRLSSVGHVLIRGRRAPVLGRVCMNMFMADVTHIPEISLEDEAILLGGQLDERVSAEDMASLCHTINYEIVTQLGGHIPRVVVA